MLDDDQRFHEEDSQERETSGQVHYPSRVAFSKEGAGDILEVQVG